MKNYSTEDYTKLYNDLPPENKSVFWDDDSPNRVGKISKRFGLTELEESFLFKTVIDLFLGTLPPSEIKPILLKEFGERQGTLPQEVIRFIIYPTQHILRNLYSEEEFDKIGVKKDFSDNETKRSESDFGDSYRETI